MFAMDTFELELDYFSMQITICLEQLGKDEVKLDNMFANASITSTITTTSTALIWLTCSDMNNHINTIYSWS